MDLPPPSDAQLASLLEQQKKKRTRLILLFAGIGVTVVAAIGISSLVFGKQARKKGDLAYSRATKCLVGTPVAPGEDAMLRYRAAWRGRILDPGDGGAAGPLEPGKKAAALRTLEATEEAKTRMWPNRCVAELVSLTDTLKEIGAMEEGKKDLGAASRALAKATAGDNWKNAESYALVLGDFLDEGRKAGFSFVDVPDVAPPALVDAKPLDELRDPKAIAGPIDIETSFAPGELVVFVPPSNRGPARVCRGIESGPLRCTPASAAGLPPEASGVPAVLDFADGAAPLLAFGRRRRVMDGQGVTTGVFRAGDGFRIVPSNAYYLGGGWSSKAGTQTVLLKDAQKPAGFAFKIMTTEGEKVKTEDVELADWNGSARALAVIASRVYWVTDDGEVRMRGEGLPKKGLSLFKLPGPVEWMHGCTIGASHALVVRTAAGGSPRIIVSFDDSTTPAVVGGGNVSCGAEAVHVVSDDTIAVCKASGCQPEPIAPALGIARARVGDHGFVVGDLSEGLLVVRTFKGDQPLGETVFDSRITGGKLAADAAVRDVRAVSTRHGAVLAVDIAGATSFLGVNESGAVTRLSVEP
jgi:hypothetical protein